MFNLKFAGSTILLLACTYFIFDLIFPEHTTLFVIDLLVVAIAEIIWLCNLFFFTSKGTGDLSNVAFMHYLSVGSFFLVAWMVIYNLIFAGTSDFITFYVGCLIISVLTILGALLTSTTAHVAQKKQEFVQTQINNKKDYKVEISNYVFNTKKALRKASFEGKEDIIIKFQTAADKASTIPADAMNKKGNEAESVLISLSEIEIICNGTDWTKEKIEALNEKISDLTFCIKNLKS